MPQTATTTTRLRETTSTTPTALWNDSCSIDELSSSISQNGAVGATANPVEMHLWKDRIPAIIKDMPRATEDQVAWRLVEEMTIRAARLLEPVFQRDKGRNGRLSVQTDPGSFKKAYGLYQERGIACGSFSQRFAIISIGPSSSGETS